MSHLKKWIAKRRHGKNKVDEREKKVGLSSATESGPQGLRTLTHHRLPVDDNGACGTFTLTQNLMMGSHVNHLGRQTIETFWILQGEVAVGYWIHY